MRLEQLSLPLRSTVSMRWSDSEEGGGVLSLETEPPLELEVIIDPWDGEAWGLWRLAGSKLPLMVAEEATA